MNDAAMWVIGVAVTVLVPAVVGLVGWVWTLWQSHNALKLKVAEEYPKAEAIREVKNEIRDLRDEFKQDLREFQDLIVQDFRVTQRVMIEVAKRLEIPAALLEPYRQ